MQKNRRNGVSFIDETQQAAVRGLHPRVEIMRPQTKVDSVLESFVRDVRAMVEQATVTAVERALRSEPTIRVTTRASVVGSRVIGEGVKRTTVELERVKAEVLETIAANPGRSVEGLAGVMGVRTAEITLPIAKLLSDGLITKIGDRRATKYFPA